LNSHDDLGYRARGFPGGLVLQGKTPEEHPYPLELALGNIVKLNEPYSIDRNPRHRPAEPGQCTCGFGFEGYDGFREHLKQSGYRFGIIVEHIGYNWRGEPRVSLHLYDDEGFLLMGPNNIPGYVDFAAAEFQVHKIASESGYLTQAMKRASAD